MFNLLINPAPKGDESLAGYLHRLGHSNGLVNGEVLEFFKSSNDYEVYEWLGCEQRPISWQGTVDELRKPSVSNQKAWSFSNPKYCPICLLSDFYWRELWDLNLYTTCTRHGVQLLYACPFCEGKNNLSLLKAKSCSRCGHSILNTNKSTEIIDPARHWISRQLEKLFKENEADQVKSFDALSYEEFHQLAFRIGVRTLSVDRFITLKTPMLDSLSIAPQLASAAGTVLMGWPVAFHQLLADLKHVRKSKIYWQLASAFGPIYNDVYMFLNNERFDFVRSEFERYVVLNWDGPLAKRNRRLSECTLLEHRWLPLKKAGRMTGLPESFLRRMHLSGELETREFQYACGKISAVVDIEQARKLSTDVREPLNLRECSRLLWLSKKRIEQLIMAGLLKISGDAPKRGERWLIRYDSILDLMPSVFLQVSGDDYITISQVAKHYLPTADGFPQLMKAIKSGDVSVFCGADSEAVNIGKWLVSSQEIKAKTITFHTTPRPNGFSIGEAAKVLGVKEEVAYALVRGGQLGSEIVQCSRRSAQLVSNKSIEHFQRNYILAPEIGKVLKMSTISVRHYLRKWGFNPIAGPSLLRVQCRQNVWRRTKKLSALLVSIEKKADK
ncbi:TniQ family protein [Pseudomonas poae]|uniref:TniQ family protein n=1 Tax=Pseudomonas poae TaxID=200451 RepID=UPI0034D5F2EB